MAVLIKKGRWKIGPDIIPTVGYGYAFLSTITGGAGGTSVSVATAAEYIAAIQTTGVMDIRVTADITYDGVTGSGTLKTVQGNKTIWSSNGRKVKGIGHWLTGATGGNIICRNIIFAGSGYDTDTFRIGGSVEGVYFDHCTFTGETEYWDPAPVEGSQTDNDGALDGGNDWKNVTFGNCRFDTWDKLMLLQNQLGPKRGSMTWYNCYVTNVKQRVPSVYACDLHIFNTVFENSRGGAQITLHEDSKLLLEQCYIDDYTKTIHCWADFTGDIDPRSETDNLLVNASVLYDPSMLGTKNLVAFNPVYRAALVTDNVIKPMDATLATQIKATAGATLLL